MDVSDAAASIYSGVGGVSERDHRYAHCHPRARSFHAEFGGEKCFGRQQRIAFARADPARGGPRERNSLLASETFFPTKFGMETSRPWMAMRIAVIALRNAADARINASSSIRNIHSSRSRKFIGIFFGDLRKPRRQPYTQLVYSGWWSSGAGFLRVCPFINAPSLTLSFRACLRQAGEARNLLCNCSGRASDRSFCPV